MKQSLSLKLGQQLTMTPQLQQAIRLLQLSTLDLRQEIQQAIESNPMLELVEDGDDDAPSESNDEEVAAADSAEEFRELAGDGDVAAEQMPEELPVDSSWDDAYQHLLDQANDLAELGALARAEADEFAERNKTGESSELPEQSPAVLKFPK